MCMSNDLFLGLLKYKGSISLYPPVCPANRKDVSHVFSLRSVVLPLVLDHSL
jgi:hypothetical protein